MSPSLHVPGLHYSYETCDATDSFTSYYTHRDGVINLCSVFSTEAAAGNRRRGCGDTDTLAQVRAKPANPNLTTWLAYSI